MQSFVVVVSQIFLERAIDDRNVVRKVIEAFFLECPVEAFNVGIVVRLSDPRIAMLFLHLLNEPAPKLGTMVGLEHIKSE